MNEGEETFDQSVQERLLAAASLITVDVDAKWERLVERLAPSSPSHGAPTDADVGTYAATNGSAKKGDRSRRPVPGLAAVMGFAAVILIVLFFSGPMGRVAVGLVRFITDTPAPVIDTSTTLPPTTTTTAAPPPRPVTTIPPVATTTPVPDPGHVQLENGTEYEQAIRQIHLQLNEAIGYNNSNYEALEGAPEIVERLPGAEARVRHAASQHVGTPPSGPSGQGPERCERCPHHHLRDRAEARNGG